jgi:hypothetical protein
MTSIEEFTNAKIETIKSVAREHAIKDPVNDMGLNIKITHNSIKQNTGRERLKQPAIDKIVKSFESAGMEVSKEDKHIQVYCPPLLQQKEEYTLEEIEERKAMMDDLNTIQAYQAYKEFS